MSIAGLNAGGFRVSALTDIAWQYTRNLVGQADNDGLQIRLNDLAGTFFTEDVNGDGSLDSEDIPAFFPLNATHRERLNFDFQILSAQNEDGNSIISCYHNDLKDILPELLEDNFGSRLSLYPSTDVRYDKVKIEVVPFGRGTVRSDKGGIDFDSERENLQNNVSSAFFEQDATDKVTITASPMAETEILSWDGCDSVSEDKTRCECNMRTDHLVSVSFGYKETLLHEGITLVDLSNAGVIVSTDQVTLNVTASIGDTDMMAKLEALNRGDVVVGSSDGGFLREVFSIQKITADNYILTTGDVALEDVVAQGTGIFSKQMTHGDLAEDATSGSGRQNRQGTQGFGETEHVRLLPSDDPNDPVFRIEIGDPRKRASIEGSLNWPSNDDPKISLEGSVEVLVDVDTGVSFGMWPPGMDYFKFVPKINATESLNVTFTGEVSTPSGDDAPKIRLTTLKFNPIYFSIGPVPVWLEPEVGVFFGIEASVGGKISTGITLRQEFRAGVVYHRDSGAEGIAEFTHTEEFNSPRDVEIYAEIKPYVETSPVVRIYSVMGPSINLKGYLKLKGEPGTSVYKNDECSQGVDFTARYGIETSWKWDMSRVKKLGKWAENVELGGKLFKGEFPLHGWNIGGTCDDLSKPHLEVSGTDIYESVEKNSGTILTKDYVVRNTGDLDMDGLGSFV